MAKKALGKGLGALITQHSAPGKTTAEIKGSLEIDINEIESNKNQPRKYFAQEELHGLADSIRSVGVIEPLVLRRKGNKYEIITGERRWRASKLAGLKKVPAIIKDVSDNLSMEMALIENIQREDLNPIEEAIAYKELLENLNIKQDELSKRVGKSRVAISNTIRLLTLPASVRSMIIEGRISAGHARTLLRLRSKNQIELLAEKAVKKGYSVRELEKITAGLDTKAKPSKKKKTAKKAPEVEDVESRLQEFFGTRVNINQGKKGGKIEIIYYDLGDLERILEAVEHQTELEL